MGNSAGKKKAVIALKTDNTFTRAEEIRHRIQADDLARANASFGSLEAEGTPPYSPRFTGKQKTQSHVNSSISEVVKCIDVTTTTSRVSYPRRRVDSRRTLICENILPKPKVTANSHVNFDAQMQVEALKGDDPYDKLSKRHRERRQSLDSPEFRTSSMKLIRPRRQSNETIAKRGLGSFIGLVKNSRASGLHEKEAHDKDNFVENGRLEDSTIRRRLVSGPILKSANVTYRITHRRTHSQKEIPHADEVHWDALNSKRAERVWQWKGAYGSLARLGRTG